MTKQVVNCVLKSLMNINFSFFFRKCPGNFATVIAREVTDQVLATDLGAFIEPPEDVANPDKDETLSETEDNKTVEEGDFKKLHR